MNRWSEHLDINGCMTCFAVMTFNKKCENRGFSSDFFYDIIFRHKVGGVSHER